VFGTSVAITQPACTTSFQIAAQRHGIIIERVVCVEVQQDPLRSMPTVHHRGIEGVPVAGSYAPNPTTKVRRGKYESGPVRTSNEGGEATGTTGDVNGSRSGPIHCACNLRPQSGSGRRSDLLSTGRRCCCARAAPAAWLSSLVLHVPRTHSTPRRPVSRPDLPGFGFTEVPEERRYEYSFDVLAGTIEAFADALGLNRYAIYVFDYGAPTGFRLAMRHPERVTAIVSQNGNAYEEGLSDAWQPIRKYWSQPTAENREVIRQNILTLEGTRWQYTHGVANPEEVPPESWTLDAALLERPGNKDIQLDLFLNYASNVKLYPKFQEYFRRSKPPLLAIWGKNDPFFLPAGAEAYRKDLPAAQIQFLDTGHFAIETHFVEIAAAMKQFLKAAGVSGPTDK